MTSRFGKFRSAPGGSVNWAWRGCGEPWPSTRGVVAVAHAQPAWSTPPPCDPTTRTGLAPTNQLTDPLSWYSVTLTIGIVGLPNVGKSTLFNALTKNDVLAANYPFATIEPNVGVVGLPDERLNQLAEMFDSVKIDPGAGVVRRHRRSRARRVQGSGPRQRVPRQHPRRLGDLPGGARLLRPQRGPRRRQDLAGRRHRDDQHRADARRPPDRRQGAAAAREGGTPPQGPRARARRRHRPPATCSTRE